LEEPSRVTTTSMISAASAGVNMYKAAATNSEVMPSALITKAATRAMHSTSTEKMAALLVSVSFVNISQPPFSRWFFSSMYSTSFGEKARDTLPALDRGTISEG
jgi:hypothetical protein